MTYLHRLIDDATGSGPKLTVEEVLAMLADQSNWTQLHQDQKCYWSWIGPVLPPWEFVGRFLQRMKHDEHQTKEAHDAREGIPYSVGEARELIKQPNLDVYIKSMLNWLCDQIEDHEGQVE